MCIGILLQKNPIQADTIPRTQAERKRKRPADCASIHQGQLASEADTLLRFLATFQTSEIGLLAQRAKRGSPSFVCQRSALEANVSSGKEQTLPYAN